MDISTSQDFLYGLLKNRNDAVCYSGAITNRLEIAASYCYIIDIAINSSNRSFPNGNQNSSIVAVRCWYRTVNSLFKNYIEYSNNYYAIIGDTIVFAISGMISYYIIPFSVSNRLSELLIPSLFSASIPLVVVEKEGDVNHINVSPDVLYGTFENQNVKKLVNKIKTYIKFVLQNFNDIHIAPHEFDICITNDLHKYNVISFEHARDTNSELNSIISNSISNDGISLVV